MLPGLASIGLLLDIVGVVILFICTATKKIEAETSYGVYQAFTDADGESERGEFDEHQKRMEKLLKSVKRNRRGSRLGLFLIVSGFVLQLVANWP